MNEHDKKISRRDILRWAGIGATSIVGAGLAWYVSSLPEVVEEEAIGTPTPTPKERKDQKVKAEALKMLEEKGVSGEIPLISLKDISHIAMSGGFTFGTGDISEERIAVYEIQWTPNPEGSIFSNIPEEKIRFNLISPSEETPDPQATIRFEFNMDKFYKKEFGYLDGVKNFGDNPEAYIVPENISYAVITMTYDHNADLTTDGIVNFPPPLATPVQ